MTSTFVKATKRKSKFRFAIAGPSGSGKTWTALECAKALSPDGKIAFIDTEAGSSNLYADFFDFKVTDISDDYHPYKFIEKIHEAEREGFEVIVLDSISHAWNQVGGVLEIVDREKKRLGGDGRAAWAIGTKIHNEFIQAMIGSKCHIVATMRSKQAYNWDKNSKDRTTTKKFGMDPIQRDGMDYEFTVFATIDTNHTLIIDKTRIKSITDMVIDKPGAEFFQIIKDWLESGAEPLPIPGLVTEAKAIQLRMLLSDVFKDESFTKMGIPTQIVHDRLRVLADSKDEIIEDGRVTGVFFKMLDRSVSLDEAKAAAHSVIDGKN